MNPPSDDNLTHPSTFEKGPLLLSSCCSVGVVETIIVVVGALGFGTVMVEVCDNQIQGAQPSNIWLRLSKLVASLISDSTWLLTLILHRWRRWC
mmetsp:Transcript_14994/g.23929  ORF Transcript_14994/g.23929 Transcript_14994/m.23929 type:complete len:94 (-) Transcript_14994:165-446(-)